MNVPREEVHATYYLETIGDPASSLRAFAGELSSGTFVDIPGESESLKEQHAASIIESHEVALASDQGYPTRFQNDSPRSAWTVTVAIPTANIGPNLPALVTTVAGNVFELGHLTGLRLIDVNLPSSYRMKFDTPRHGIAGSRQLMGVQDRPMFGSIIKPSVGLTPTATADLVYDLAMAGLDFIKDDELQANAPSAPFDERFRLVSAALDRAADVTGRRIPFAFNISDNWDQMRRHRDSVCAKSRDILMVTIESVGHAAVSMLSKDSPVPLHAHRAGWAVRDRAPGLGMSFRAYQKLWRLAGIDQLHVGGLDSKFYQRNSDVIDAIQDCWAPHSKTIDDTLLPVLSSGQTYRHVATTLDATVRTDFLMLAGGGILGHPNGPAAGVESFHLAYEDHQRGTDPDKRSGLKRALNHAPSGAESE